MSTTNIVVIEDHPLFRQGLVDTLSLNHDFVVVGQASNGTEGFKMIQQLQPDIVVCDINMPGKNGQQVTNEVTQNKGSSRVILMTAFASEDQMLHAAIAGARGFCSKDILPDELLALVENVRGGKYVMSDKVMSEPEFKTWLSGSLLQYSKVYSDPGNPLHPLSDRELEVLHLIVEGKNNKEIAFEIKLSEQTVKNHITSIYRKFGVEDRTQAVIYAVKKGWVKIL